MTLSSRQFDKLLLEDRIKEWYESPDLHDYVSSPNNIMFTVTYIDDDNTTRTELMEANEDDEAYQLFMISNRDKFDDDGNYIHPQNNNPIYDEDDYDDILYHDEEEEEEEDDYIDENYQDSMLTRRGEYRFLEDAPIEILFNIAKDIPVSKLNALCMNNRRLNNILCNNNNFWKDKYLNDYYYRNDNIKDILDWKSLYKSIYRNIFVQGSFLNKKYDRYTSIGVSNVKNVWIGSHTIIYRDIDNYLYKIDQGGKERIFNTKFKEVSVGYDHIVAISYLGDVLGMGTYASAGLFFGSEFGGESKKDAQYSRSHYHRHFVKNTKIIPLKVSCGMDYTAMISNTNNILIYGFGFKVDKNLRVKNISAGPEDLLAIDMGDNLHIFTRNGGRNGMAASKVKSAYAGSGVHIFIDYHDNCWAVNSKEWKSNALYIPYMMTNIKMKGAGNCDVNMSGYGKHGSCIILLDMDNNLWTTKLQNGNIILSDKIQDVKAYQLNDGYSWSSWIKSIIHL
ncbi:RCC1/BLIP-II protein [Orpheovirus IHUMI-LCC2]|uniref:RCC1/BLIP-II protein n=1 Tax=Orpheovirus IHUMI-LCC2 TaxID=2023057 RepID=A0A2I2L342_9VIRU|nr:RCC1/BLIP-II protein [Orpheovirus IHUMI-LCC2]SNW61943.1 RCC1/BLIP-II protein [Orpheovirus IHUMI-LCC2]